MPNLQHRLFECYVFIEDYLQSHSNLAAWRRSVGGDPDFTDAEVITIALMQCYFQTDTLKRIYHLVSKSMPETFPKLLVYKQKIRRLNKLTDLFGRLARAAALKMAATNLKRLYVADSFPIPLCEPIRHGRVRLLSEDRAYFGGSAKGWFFGVQLHALIHQPTGVVFTAMLLPLGWGGLALSTEGGVLLGDQDYSGEETFDWLNDAKTLRGGPSDKEQRRTLGCQSGTPKNRK